MGLTNFPNGITSFGVPVLGSGGIVTTGNVFFVDSGSGVDSVVGGRDPATPLATIDYAVGLCTANNGDYIVAMPGHAETVSAAGGLDLDVAGITLLGIGEGNDTPTVTLGTADTADVDVDAASITIENIHFVAAVADVAVCIDVNADWCTIRNCRFTEATDLNFLVCVQAGTANQSDYLVVEDCYANCPDAANTHFINFPAAEDGCIVRRNVLMGDWGTMAIGGAGVVTHAAVLDNVIYNAASDVDSCINFAATATGFCARNLVSNAALQAQQITATAMGICENYGAVNSEDLSGILEPAGT